MAVCARWIHRRAREPQALAINTVRFSSVEDKDGPCPRPPLHLWKLIAQPCLQLLPRQNPHALPGGAKPQVFILSFTFATTAYGRL